tara:strand:+ start:559 stop:690 length:132 start_codon:yes stop_codon:yes gene_type:complete
MDLSKNKFQILSAILFLGVAALAKAPVDKRYQPITRALAPKKT